MRVFLRVVILDLPGTESIGSTTEKSSAIVPHILIYCTLHIHTFILFTHSRQHCGTESHSEYIHECSQR